ncbi:hypothetical protein F0L68_34065 [Solihabitans fulvus]|uniref:Uncharacterized protein n=1 Tax=Solihabitans fulvus TaxID=1892852 RepID=A0A5B2WPQ5_9PSEU|nr:hypothetical protein [Solihabitans fulvus]KAA2252918.1 hypothetical protein F0L68_34065 [Solihabitans fulvus]
MAIETFPYSAFLRGPTEVLGALEHAEVVLERRDAENLVLIRSERFNAGVAALTAAAHLLRTLARRDPELAAELLAEEFAWMRWLPESERTLCVADLLADLSAGAETGYLLPFANTVAAWRSTAEVWSDPDLARALSSPITVEGDGVEITRPLPEPE